VREAIARWTERYPGLGEYAERIKRELDENGFVSTLFGRRRYIPEVFMPDQPTRDAGYRQGVNHPIQGTAADVIKIMLKRVDDELDPDRAAIVTTVHDELDLESDPDYIPTAVEIVRYAAKDVLPGIPLPMEFEVGESWGELKDYEAF
jgi:DNA polymerase-1